MNNLRSFLEGVIIRGDKKYMSRGGKYYQYDSDGTRIEITADQYKSVLGPRKSRPDVGAKAQNKNSIKLTINGRQYSASHPDMTAKELADKIQSMSKHSPGRAIQWLKKNGQISHVGEPAQKSKEPKKDSAEG